jgi:hypothetical protein
MKELLRCPQHLVIFLNISEPPANEQKIFHSYLALLHQLWEKEINKEHLEKILLEIAWKMSDREELWLPSMHWNVQDLESLSSKGFLILEKERGKVGFRHQTIFEYARARAFVKTDQSLSKYVLERQDGIFVRPLLWNLLPYLREADPFIYKKELSLLWKADLSFHIRVLLIEFMGQLDDATDLESNLLLEYLEKPDYTGTVLISVAGSKSWFERICDQYLPMAMSKEVEVPGLAFVLSQALTFASEKVLSLIRTVWLPDSKKDNQTFRVLLDLQKWDEELSQS